MSDWLTKSLYVWASSNGGRELMVTDRDTGLRLTYNMMYRAHSIVTTNGRVLKDGGLHGIFGVPNRLHGARVNAS